MAALYLEPPLQVAQVGGVSRGWREAGQDGRLPLVLVHGIGSNARAWAGQFAAFAATRRVVAVNTPGYAGSDPLPMEWPTAADYAAALSALLDHLRVNRCILVGQSLGAIVTAQAALDDPGRVAGLALASPAIGYGAAPGGDLPATVARRVSDLDALGPAGLANQRAGGLLTASASAQARQIVHRAMSEVTPRGYLQAARLLAVSDLKATVRGLALPVRVVWGSDDAITPPASCRAVAEEAPGATWQEAVGVGHGFATQSPTVFNSAIQPLLDIVDAQET